jgi:hypothetical protein
VPAALGHYLQKPAPLDARRQLLAVHATDPGLIVKDSVVGS